MNQLGCENAKIFPTITFLSFYLHLQERYRSYGYRWPAIIPRRWLPTRSDKDSDSGVGKEDLKKPRSTLVIAVVAVVSVVSVIAIGVAAAIIIMSEYFHFARD